MSAAVSIRPQITEPSNIATARDRRDRRVRLFALEVATTKAEDHLALAESCVDMILHWAERAEHHRKHAEHWTAIAEAGAKLVAAVPEEKRVSCATWGADTK
jgi:hypothetical protein